MVSKLARVADPAEVTRSCVTCGNPLTGKKSRRYCSDFCAKARPCSRCGVAKVGRSRFCIDCQRDRTPGVALTLAPEWQQRQATRDSRPSRRPSVGPDGLWWCSGCREWLTPRWFLLLKDLRSSRTPPTLCRACRSARGHATRLRTEFALSPEGYEALLNIQEGGCAICDGKPRTERLAVDHDHDTGEIRGLLCSKCNTDLLKGVRHSAKLAARAAAYLMAPPARTGTPVPFVVAVSVADLRALVQFTADALGKELESGTSSAATDDLERVIDRYWLELI